MTQTFDRSQLDGKDREQLSQIATALGVKSISRMRKAELVDAILGTAPQVQVLATSRELLDVPGEQSYPILPLPLPPRDAGAATER